MEASSSCRRYLSGTPDDDLSFQSETGVAFRGYKTRGGWYKTVKSVQSLSECFQTCVNETQCFSFTYKASRDSCSLSKKSGATSSSEVSSDTVKFCRSRSSIAGFMAAPRSPSTAIPPSLSSKAGFTLQEVAQHDVAGDAWVAVDGKVFDLSDFVRIHPGGSSAILRVAGADGTSLFDGIRAHGSRERSILNNYYIGDLESMAVENIGPASGPSPITSPSLSPSSGGSTNGTMPPDTAAPGPDQGGAQPPVTWWDDDDDDDGYGYGHDGDHEESEDHEEEEEEHSYQQQQQEQHEEHEDEDDHHQAPLAPSSPAPVTSSPNPNPNPSPLMSQQSPVSWNHEEDDDREEDDD